jgi:hypothetical protein
MGQIMAQRVNEIGTALSYIKHHPNQTRAQSLDA